MSEVEGGEIFSTAAHSDVKQNQAAVDTGNTGQYVLKNLYTHKDNDVSCLFVIS